MCGVNAVTWTEEQKKPCGFIEGCNVATRDQGRELIMIVGMRRKGRRVLKEITKRCQSQYKNQKYVFVSTNVIVIKTGTTPKLV